MSKIKKPNFTQIPNVYLDEIMYTLPPTENIVLLFIMRKTFGWQKTRDVISYSQIQAGTGLSRPTVIRAVKELEKAGLVKSKKKKNGIEYSINIHEEDDPASKNSLLVKNLDQSKIFTSTSKNSLPLGAVTSKNSLPTKEKNIKKLSKERMEAEPPSSVTLIHTHFTENYKRLHEQGRVLNEKPIVNYAKTGALIKSLLASVTVDQLKTVLDNAMKDDWIMKGGYSLEIILSSTQVHRLLNARAEPKHRIKQDEVEDYEQYFR